MTNKLVRFRNIVLTKSTNTAVIIKNVLRKFLKSFLIEQNLFLLNSLIFVNFLTFKI